MHVTTRKPKWTQLPGPPCLVGESPIWCASEQSLYWIDIDGCAIHCWNWGASTTRLWRLPERIGCIALHKDGGMLAAMQSGIYHWKPKRGLTKLLRTAPYNAAVMRFNDGRCDRNGRFWVTTMLLANPDGALAGELYRLDSVNGITGPIVSGLGTGNGLAFSEDGTTVYLSDSHASVRKIWRYRLDRDGNLSSSREPVDMSNFQGRPDGAAMDNTGNYWSCGNDAGLIHKFSPRGQLLESWSTPFAKPSMCAFGGPNLDHLFVTSIRPTAPANGFDPSVAGQTMMTELTGIYGILETKYG